LCLFGSHLDLVTQRIGLVKLGVGIVKCHTL
jgi:hypothetical protein